MFIILKEKKWDIPLDCTMDSKICNNCAENVLAMILEKYMTTDDCSIDIPGKLKIYIKQNQANNTPKMQFVKDLNANMVVTVSCNQQSLMQRSISIGLRTRKLKR